MSNINIVLRKKPNAQKECPLAIRITKDRKSIYYYTGKYISPAIWDDKKKQVKKSHGLNSTLLNNYLSKQKALVLDEILNLEATGKDYSLRELKRKLNKGNTGNSFFKFAEEYFSIMEDAGNFNRLSAESPALSHFKTFCKNEDLEFKDITVFKLEKFKAFLTKSGISHRTIFNLLIVIRTIYNRAIKNGLVDKSHYPFGENGLKLRRPTSQKLGLDVEDIKAIESYEPQKSNETLAKAVFLFSFYFAGMRVSDVLQIKWSDIFDGRLHYVMGKNKKPGSIKIPEKANSIIEQYKAKTNGRTYLFPPMNKYEGDNEHTIEFKKRIKYETSRINIPLKSIGVKLNLPIKLTMHISRHSFATISGDKIPLQRLQQLYRHSSITTTIGYQNAFMNKGTDEALDQVLDY